MLEVFEVLGSALSLERSDIPRGMWKQLILCLSRQLVVLGWAWTGSIRTGQSRDVEFPPSWERKEKSASFLVEESPVRQFMNSTFPPPLATKQYWQPLQTVFWELLLC